MACFNVIFVYHYFCLDRPFPLVWTFVFKTSVLLNQYMIINYDYRERFHNFTVARLLYPCEDKCTDNNYFLNVNFTPEFTPVFCWVRVAHLFFVVVVVFVLFCFFFCFFALSYYVSSRSEFRVVMSYAISVKEKLCSVCLYLQLFVGGRMSYLRYLCLLCTCCPTHIMLLFFVWFFFVLCTLCWQFLWIGLFWLPLRYSLTFIQIITTLYFWSRKLQCTY